MSASNQDVANPHQTPSSAATLHRLRNRLEQLEASADAGQRELAEIDERQRQLRTTMLRVSGAIAVLEEEVTAAHDGNGADPLAGAVEQRLGELREEMATGRSLLEDLARREDDLRSALLQTGGAIQVLHELLDGEAANGPPT